MAYILSYYLLCPVIGWNLRYHWFEITLCIRSGDLKYYFVLQNTTLYYKVLLHYYPAQYTVLLCTTQCYSSTTLYYKCTTPVLLCTAKYYSSTTLYYTILQRTTPVVLCSTKYYSSTVLLCTTKYYNVLLQ